MSETRYAILAYKACVSAVWSDGAMAVEERRYLASLIEQSAADERERSELRQHSLADIDGEEVLREIAALPEDGKKRVFELCVEVLSADRRLPPAELTFLGKLRRTCGVGLFAYEGRLWRLRREGVRVGSRRRSALVVLLFFTLFGALSREREAPKASPSRREVRLSPIAGGPAGVNVQGSPELAYRFIQNSFATVEVQVDGRMQALGSASVLGEDSKGDVYLLTNRHVVAQRVPPGRKVTFLLHFLPDDTIVAALDFVSETWDLALLRIPRPRRPRIPLPLRPRLSLEVGQRVFALGSPQGLAHSFTAGIVSALREDYLQTDATVDSGSSGGPLVDADGRLCGVVTRAHVRKNFAFAVYADTVMQALLERRKRQEPFVD
ncbi:MAG: trypsin-like peptidase domain-containing protein [Elusimicrobia bacterium]|nr:trypsin-like peptidase domain-containing protein [Elusimicrobiota bacterium]